MRILGLDYLIWGLFLSAISGGSFWMPIAVLAVIDRIIFFGLSTWLDIPPTVPDTLFWGWYIIIGAISVFIAWGWVWCLNKDKEWYIKYGIVDWKFKTSYFVYFIAFMLLLLSHWIPELFAATNYVWKIPVYGAAVLAIVGGVWYYDHYNVLTHETMITEGMKTNVDDVEEANERRQVMKEERGYWNLAQVKAYWMPFFIAIALVFIANWIAQPLYAAPLLDQYTERNIQFIIQAGLILIGLFFSWKYVENKKEY